MSSDKQRTSKLIAISTGSGASFGVVIGAVLGTLIAGDSQEFAIWVGAGVAIGAGLGSATGAILADNQSRDERDT